MHIITHKCTWIYPLVRTSTFPPQPSIFQELTCKLHFVHILQVQLLHKHTCMHTCVHTHTHTNYICIYLTYRLINKFKNSCKMHYSQLLFSRNIPVINEMMNTYHTGSYKIIQKGFNQTPMTSHNYNKQENATYGAFVLSLSTCVKFVNSLKKKQIFFKDYRLSPHVTNRSTINQDNA